MAVQAGGGSRSFCWVLLKFVMQMVGHDHRAKDHKAKDQNTSPRILHQIQMRAKTPYCTVSTIKSPIDHRSHGRVGQTAAQIVAQSSISSEVQGPNSPVPTQGFRCDHSPISLFMIGLRRKERGLVLLLFSRKKAYRRLALRAMRHGNSPYITQVVV